MSEVTSDSCLSAIKTRIDDSNVSNHLFRLEGSILDKPGIISAKWNNVGVLKKETVWSFATLRRKVQKCIVFFQQNGLKKGDRVLLMVRPGLELIVICFSLFRLGCIPIVIDPGMGLKKFRRAVRHSKPRVMIGIPVSNWVRRIFSKSFRSVEKTIVVRDRTFFSQIETKDPLSMKAIPEVTSDDLAAILFTSGSTGAPKGVCYEHGMLDAQIRLLKEYLDIKPGEIDLPMLPIFALFNPAMGMTTVIPEINPSRPATVNPVKIVAAIKRYEVTNSFGSPVLWRKIGDYCENEGVVLNSMKRILVAGSAAPTQLYKQFYSLIPHGKMYSPYGATECLPVSIVDGVTVIEKTANKTDRGAGICVGRPLNEVAVRIIRSEKNNDMVMQPVGSIGEIMVNGPSVTKAYDGLPEVNEKAKYIEGDKIWHRMGDMGYLDNDGRLWFCGRKVESIQGIDMSFYTECVEGKFLTYPSVKRCALIHWSGRGGCESKNSLALVVEPLKSSYPLGEEAQKQFAKNLILHLFDNDMNSEVNAFFFHKSLPVDVRHNAKIHRLNLAEHYSTRQPVIIHSAS